MRRLILAIGCLVMFSLQSAAQTPDNGLRGISQIKLLIESLDAKSIQCNLNKDGIRNAILYPASSAKFVMSEEARSTLLVNAVTIYLQRLDLCVTHIKVEVYSLQQLMLDASGREIFAEVRLWDEGGIFSTGRSEHAQHISGSVENFVKKFVTDWNLDNK